MTSTYGQTNKFDKQFATQFIRLDNYNVHYLKKGKGQPLLLIHGGGTWMYSWRNIIDPLSKKYTVYACDMPGHGYTTADIEPKYDLADFADFIDKFISYNNIDKVTIIGNSWGGGWALYYAEIHPDKVDKLILIDPSGLDVKDVFEWEILKYPVIGEFASRMVTKKAIRNAYEKVYVDHTFINDELIDQTYIPIKFRQNRRASYKIKRHCDWKVTEHKMKDIKTPTLIIWGNQDNYLNVKYSKIYASKIANSRLIILKDCGHTPHEERADETIKLINDFVLR